ncbi:hypothetical protein RHODGE_RHODGE_03289 [Rhodoplanes serenus]|uniref:Uncharacterized protein n=1 Tax=Rhodoplanes serenus TaxID=200615 RepID=A0A447CXU9_9BRAD|nr:hypothetical protein [Rhodoplanes serenus]VCU10103.1 hypothetical protein RHODGE_RHODGE_03289 [Rhodoplanes serenus]
MGKAKHTPGPWTVEDPLGPEALWIVEAGKKPHEWRCIAMVCRDDLDDHDDLDLPIGAGEQRANARLIAAAPETAAERDRLREVNAELVEALRFYSDEWERDVFGDVGDPDRFFAVVSPTNSLREDKGRRASAALAKAEGR